jgi:broad specificity phosphatase PhoE
MLSHDACPTGRHPGNVRLLSREMRERRFTFVRHASTVYNRLGLLNGDPHLPVPLDAGGRIAAAALAPLLAHCPFDLALHTRFARTRETLCLLLGRRPARGARRADPLPAQCAAPRRPARRPGSHGREPRARDRQRGAAGRRARGHAPQAVRPSPGLIRQGLSDRSARSRRRAPGARCRSARPPRPGGDDRSRCKASDACFEYAVNCNKLSMGNRTNPSKG